MKTGRPQGARDTHQKPRRYSVDDLAFDLITEQTAYWVGLLMADGCVQNSYSDGYRIYLTLNSNDVEHINSFAAFLETDAPISRNKDGTARISIHSQRLVNRLASFGVTPRKSLTAEVSIEFQSDRHFWRGLVDGDGHLRIRNDGYAVFDLVGSWPIMRQFCSFLTGNDINCNVHLRPHSSGSVGRVGTNGRYAAEIVRMLYAGAKIALPRKMTVAQAIMNL